MKIKKILNLFLLSLFLVGCNSAGKANIQYQSKLSETNVKYSNSALKNKFVEASMDVSLTKLATGENSLVSPLTLGMDYDSIALVSSKADAVTNKFGISSLEEYEFFNRAFNWKKEKEYIRSVTFHQIVSNDSKLEYKEDMRKELAFHGVATIESDNSNAQKLAKDFIKTALGKELEIPRLDMSDIMAMTYSALTIKASDNFNESEHSFMSLDNSNKIVPGVMKNATFKYHQGGNYEAIDFPINSMELTFVLPNEGVSLSSLDVKGTYLEIVENAKEKRVEAFVPFFSLETEVDYLDSFTSTFKGVGMYDKLLKDTSGLTVPFCRQKNRLIFDKNGLEGDSVTVGGMAGSMEPEKTFYVDRPFLCICSYDDVPMFVGTITNL